MEPPGRTVNHFGRPRAVGLLPAYGMLADRFGVIWVLDVAVAYEPA